MSKRILLAVPQLTGGGAERVVSVWANRLVDMGHQVAVLLFHRSSNEYELDSKVAIYSVVDQKEEYLKLNFVEKYKIFRKTIKSFKPMYIISFLPTMQIWMFLASAGTKAKRIETVRISPWDSKLAGRTNKFIWKRCFDFAHKIIIQATEQKKFFNKRNQKKCVLIPNPLSPVYDEIYKEVLSREPKEFIAVGRLTPQKNYPMMFKSFANVCKEHSNLNLRIFGTGEPRYINELENIIKSLNMENNIKLMGRTSRIEEEYKKSDIFLMSSDFEGLPNALIEAMASRLVCISTDCRTGPKDLINNGENGFLVPTGKEEEFTKAILSVLDLSDNRRNELAENARNSILKYCSEKYNTKRLLDILP